MEPEPTRLLALVDGLPWEERLERLSAELLGRPYVSAPLVGSPTEAEALVTRVDGFDCVTYVETVLALAGGRTAEGFVRRLVDLRYHLACVSWRARNHYTSDWLDRNIAMGLLRPLLPGRWHTVQRRLSALEGYPARVRDVRWLPVERVAELPVRPGDFVGFASTRADLDTFHVGLLFPGAPGPLLRHASRSAGGVVEVPLVEFLDHNETPGVLAARPLPTSPGGPP